MGKASLLSDGVCAPRVLDVSGDTPQVFESYLHE